MTGIRIPLAALALAIQGCSAQGLDGLYLQMKFAFGNFQETHYFFLENGKYLRGVPDGTLDAAGLERACAKPRSDCGIYQVKGKELTLTPAKGKPQTLSLERDGDNLKIGGVFAKRVDRFGSNARLEGKYGRIASAGAASAASSYTFKPDGTYTAFSRGAVTTRQGAGTSESASEGKYRLSGNTLELTGGGTTRRVVAYPYDLGKGDVRLNIDGVFYRKQ